MKKFTPALKRQITRDWHAHFPSMGIYKPLRLARRVGPILQCVCLGLSSGNEDYLPMTHIHPLLIARDSLSLTLKQPLASIPHGAAQRILVQFHGNHIDEAPRRLRSKSLLPLEGPFSVDDVLAAYREYAAQMGRFASEWDWNALIALLAWSGRVREAMELISEAIRAETDMHSKCGDIGDVYQERHENWCRVTREMDLDPERLDQVAQAEVIRHKLDKLPYCELKK